MSKKRGLFIIISFAIVLGICLALYLGLRTPQTTKISSADETNQIEDLADELEATAYNPFKFQLSPTDKNKAFIYTITQYKKGELVETAELKLANNDVKGFVSFFINDEDAGKVSIKSLSKGATSSTAYSFSRQSKQETIKNGSVFIGSSDLTKDNTIGFVGFGKNEAASDNSVSFKNYLRAEKDADFINQFDMVYLMSVRLEQ
ncbi:hypothetical protein [Brochothrix campestris]|uniref:Uncharacterized protein n=1 Tax=Brochothrix campestris FSL F6-1037 TaxID=1265861 RepID=W7CNX8_9LIST|nr:hypothetical protein [Brochothrix campestris]EUJ37361.1 hypothetical protein BCAMP_10030 [Brochothrix campestris FSL F6-1037]